MGSKSKHQVRGESLLRDQGCTDTSIGDQVGLFGQDAGVACHVSTKPAHYQAAQQGGSMEGRGPIVDFRLPDGRFAEVKFGKSTTSSVPWTTGTADHLNAVIWGCAAVAAERPSRLSGVNLSASHMLTAPPSRCPLLWILRGRQNLCPSLSSPTRSSASRSPLVQALTASAHTLKASYAQASMLETHTTQNSKFSRYSWG